MKIFGRKLSAYVIIIPALIFSCSDDEVVDEVKKMEIIPAAAAKNEVVLIRGKGISGVLSENKVLFNDREAEIIHAAKDELEVRVPVLAGSGTVSVFVNGAILPETVPFTYLWTVTTYAGSITESAHKDGSLTEARFGGLAGLTIDQDDNLYVYSNSRIRKISHDGVVSTVAGSEWGYQDGQGAAAKFAGVSAMAVDHNGNIYVSDGANYRIRKVSPEGMVTTVAGSEYGYQDGNALEAKFDWLLGITTDENGNVYIGDRGMLRKLDVNGQVTTLAGNGYGYLDATGAAAKFTYLFHLVRDADGNTLAIDYNNNRIRKISPDNTVSTWAGSGKVGLLDGAALNAQFRYAYSMAAGIKNDFYVCDRLNHVIRHIAENGEVSTIAGNEASGLKDGRGKEATLSFPYGIAVDSHGAIYIAESGSSAIRRID